MTSPERDHSYDDGPNSRTLSYYGVEPQNLKRSDDMKSVRFQHPGIGYCMFDRDGNATLYGMMAMSSSGEEVGFGCQTDTSIFAHDWHDNYSSLIFVLNTEMKVSKVMYQKDVNKTNITCQVALIDVGRSTCVSRISFFLRNDPEPILSLENLLVTVDVDSRKAKPLPSWIVDKFKGKKAVTTNSRRKPFSRPPNTFIHHVCVMWSDTDFNAHCNIGSYTRYADDALHTALRLRHVEKTASHYSTPGNPSPVNLSSEEDFVSQCGSPSAALKGISQQIVKKGVKNVKNDYFQECREGQKLKVHIWQDGVKDTVLYCSIERENEVICQMVLEYYASVSKL